MGVRQRSVAGHVSAADEDEFAFDPGAVADAGQPVFVDNDAHDDVVAENSAQAIDAQAMMIGRSLGPPRKLMAEPELGAENKPEFGGSGSEPVEDQPAQSAEMGFGSGSRLAPPDHFRTMMSLADMFRFEIPARQSTPAQSASFAEVQSEDASAWTAEASVDRDLEDIPFDSEGHDDQLQAGAAEEEYEPGLDPVTIRAADQPLFDESPVAAVPAQTASGAALDFEDFLATELDSFEQTPRLAGCSGSGRRDRETPEASGYTDFVADAEQDGWDDASIDDESSVF